MWRIVLNYGVKKCFRQHECNTEAPQYPSPPVDSEPSPEERKPGSLPPNVDLDVPSRDLLLRLLQIDPKKRLRSVRTLETIAFYKGYSFLDVKEKRIQPHDLVLKYYPDGPPVVATQGDVFENFDVQI